MSRYRPRSAAEIADAAIALTRERYGASLALAALLCTPGIVCSLLLARLQPAAAGALERLAWQFAQTLAVGLFSSLATGALVVLASSHYLDEAADAPEAAARAFRRALPLLGAKAVVLALTLGTAMLVGLAIAALGVSAGSLGPKAPPMAPLAAAAIVGGAFVAASAYVLARYFAVTPAVLLEGHGVWAALRRSRALTDGWRWRGALLLGVALAVLHGVRLGVSQLAVLLAAPASLVGALSQLATLPLLPAWAALMAAFYYDLRIRGEGLDVELMARAIARSVPLPDGPAAAEVAH